jgi:hypothetical protein
MTTWNVSQAIELCRRIEDIAPEFGCHVALTGGTLYKKGERKDLDILFYRIRQVDRVDIIGLFVALSKYLEVNYVSGFGWCFKAIYQGKNIDCFFPEEHGGTYEGFDLSDKPMSKHEIGLLPGFEKEYLSVDDIFDATIT